MKRNRRYQFLSSDSEDEEAFCPPRWPRTQERKCRGRRRKEVKLTGEDIGQEEAGGEESKEVKDLTGGITGGNDKEEPAEDAKPIGESIRVSGDGSTKRDHFKSFLYDGITFELEDQVLIVPETNLENPNVAIIKDISQTVDGSVMVNGQWFFRPKQVEKDAGQKWESRDKRELFFSFYHEEIPAESVMHKCIVHFIPQNKPIPSSKQHPGFIVLNAYDTKEKKLFELIDKHYEDSKQHEIDLLILKTVYRLGELPDTEMKKRAGEHEERKKRLLVVPPHSVSNDDKREIEHYPFLKPQSPGSVTSNESECFDILSKFKALSGKTHRDKWLVKHLQGIQFIFNPKDNGGIDAANDGSFKWPDSAVSAVSALEMAAYETLSSDFMKYNQKMRQLLFNLKNNTMLAQRMLNGELEPSKILKMSPNELKKGLTSEEIASMEPEKSEHLQILPDAHCKRCKEKQVALKDIIGKRYQFECIVCGYTWYGSPDDSTSLSIDKETTQKGGNC